MKYKLAAAVALALLGSGANANPVVEGNTIKTPNNGVWYQIQYKDWKLQMNANPRGWMCQGANLNCRLADGTYKVINLGNGTKQTLEVPADTPDGPDNEDITVEGKVIKLPQNGVWYQIQMSSYSLQLQNYGRGWVCQGANLSCEVAVPGVYTAINLRNGNKTENILVEDGGPDNPTGPVSADCSSKRNSNGSDVILLMGQSNMSGNGYGRGYGAGYANPNGNGGGWTEEVDGWRNADPRINQLAKNYRSDGIVQGTEPLQHADWYRSPRVGMGMSFAREYLDTLPGNRDVLLVPSAYGNTGLKATPSGGAGRWSPNYVAPSNFNATNSSLFNNAVERLNHALREDGDNCVAAVLWHQGEKDVNNQNMNYEQDLHNMIQTLRNRVPRAARAPFILGEFSDEWAQASSGNPALSVVESALRNTPNNVAYTAFASSNGLRGNTPKRQNNEPDNIHFDADSQREYGKRYFNQLSTAIGNVR